MTAEQNFKDLQNNPYPGRGIVIGATPDGKQMVQIYWIMGRSENSRNRIFEVEANGYMRTKAFDESKMTDPSLIIYFPSKKLDRCHIITNGDQTETIFNGFETGQSVEDVLANRQYEPDAPNFTPRISGVIDQKELGVAYQLSILKAENNSEEAGCLRQYFRYSNFQPGFGHCITTYQGDGNPLPSFAGEPKLMPIVQDAQECLDMYWAALNKENRVSLMVKMIDMNTDESRIWVKNRHE